MSERNRDASKDAVLSNTDKQDALSRVLASDEFRSAGRLTEFLSYVVREELEGRGNTILGKRIAQDVYGRRKYKDAYTSNVVRVDAARLRRRLADYYATEGSSDPVQIQIDKGGYVPRFIFSTGTVEPQTDTATSGQSNAATRRLVELGSAAMLGSVATALVLLLTNERADTDPNSDRQSPSEVARGALFESSPETLQAVNLAEQGRELMFPATQPNRLRAAMFLFEEAIALNPDYFGGHAGVAQAAAMFGGLAPDAEARNAMLTKARRHAEEAIRLAPSESWSQSATAFLNMFERNFEEANRLSMRAIALNPNDLKALEIDAIIAFFSGDFDRALENSAPEKHAHRAGRGLPWRNVYGNTLFHVGEYERAIDALYEAAETGGSISEINTAHLIAALHAAGRTNEAAKILVEYEEAWPQSRVEAVMFQLFEDPANATRLIETLRAAGWQSTN